MSSLSRHAPTPTPTRGTTTCSRLSGCCSTDPEVWGRPVTGERRAAEASHRSTLRVSTCLLALHPRQRVRFTTGSSSTILVRMSLRRQATKRPKRSIRPRFPPKNPFGSPPVLFCVAHVPGASQRSRVPVLPGPRPRPRSVGLDRTFGPTPWAAPRAASRRPGSARRAPCRRRTAASRRPTASPQRTRPCGSRRRTSS